MLRVLSDSGMRSARVNIMKKTRKNPPQVSSDTYLVDTHCHLDMRGYEDLDDIIASAADQGVGGIITIGIDVQSSRHAVTIARRYKNVWATIGIHPHNAENTSPEHFNQLATLALDKSNKVVGYGEIGLDYAKNYAPKERQIKEFVHQLHLAKDLKLPVIIHDRDAHEDTLQLLKQHGPFPDGGVMHCFSGDSALADQVIDLGFYISIPGIITFKKSATLQQVAREIPLEHIILETDGPFLAPVPYRGKTNRPEYLAFTAQKVADLKGISLDDVARITTENSKTLFKIYQH